MKSLSRLHLLPVSTIKTFLFEAFYLEQSDTFCSLLLEVPKPIVIYDPLYLDWDKIDANLIDWIQFTATNKGLIATDDLSKSMQNSIMT